MDLLPNNASERQVEAIVTTQPVSKRTRVKAFLPLLLLWLLSIVIMIRFDRPLIRGDGVAYLAWIDTLVLDQDINFDNQLERLQPVNTYQISWSVEANRFVNVFPFGIALLQAPFYLLGDFFLAHNWWNLNPDYFHQMQGVELPYSLWVMIGANLMLLGTVTFTWLVSRRFCGDWTAAIVAWAVFVGSPLFYYSTVSPLNSHNPGAFTTAVFVYLLADCTQAFRRHDEPLSPPIYKWLLLGFVAGVTVLVRWQLLLIIPAFGLLAWKRRWKGLLYALPIFVITMLPLPIIWQQMFGRPILVPFDAVSDQSFLSLPVNTWRVLIETPHNSPILLFSLIGLWFMWRLDRAWAIFLAVAIGLQVMINGMALDWWAGETYGVRRMTELYPVFVLSACALFGNLSSSTLPGKIGGIVAKAALSLLILYSFLYILSFFSFTWTNPDLIFISDPATMIRYFLNQGHRWEVIGSLFQTHLGPPAWSMPGP